VRVIIVFACLSLFLASVGLPLAGNPGRSEMVSAENSPSRSDQMSCAVRIQEFVSELDILLEKNPNTLEPFWSLLQKYFPLTECDIQEVKSISKKSKYFDSVYEQGSLAVFSFSNASPYSMALSGFDISFAISKSTGNTELPFAKIHKGR
jgi:hypothetical protein